MKSLDSFEVPAIAAIALVALVPAVVAQAAEMPSDPFAGPFAEHCAVCHGAQMQGAAQGTPLVGVSLKHGDGVPDLAKSIREGAATAGMPAFGSTLDAAQIQRLALYISEQRAGRVYTDFKVELAPQLPAGVVRSALHDFRVEEVVTGIDRLPYALAALPDGSFLVTEKARGLRVLSPDGKLSPLIAGTPQVFDDGFDVPGIRLVYGQGHLMDVQPHPDYARNGWIYLHYTERCSDCNESSRAIKRPVSMNKVVRGRIQGGQWVDQQTIWSTDLAYYTAMPDMAAGGRLAFDGAGHLFLSVGVKGGSEFAGVQDLSQPYGKIHRVNEDGTIPRDNPFVDVAGAMPSIWSYGHRSPQGLKFDRRTGQLWETEMGPRGGDEVNLLRAGGNYGWPLRSKGMNYDGTPVGTGLQPAAGTTLVFEDPVVDLTPSPAVASFVIYEGAAFPRWQQSLLVGTLKATELLRMQVEGGRVTRVEKVLEGLGRIRDVATAADGTVYLLLEHVSGGRIVRLVPAVGIGGPAI